MEAEKNNKQRQANEHKRQNLISNLRIKDAIKNSVYFAVPYGTLISYSLLLFY